LPISGIKTFTPIRLSLEEESVMIPLTVWLFCAMEAKQQHIISAKENIILGKSQFLFKIKLLRGIDNEVNVKKSPAIFAGLLIFVI
tara:strand:- start:2442 stop:2699 length:258 start_codon:yes stop_codon:yes gene_type:complete